MNILIVTGKLAEPIIKSYLKDSKLNFSILTLPFAVAALMTTNYIANHLKNFAKKEYDMILVPGLIRGNVSVITESIGIKTFKGPKHAADLPIILSKLKSIELSSRISADEIISNELDKKIVEILNKVEIEKSRFLRKKGNIQIGNIAAGIDFPIRIVAEIADIPKLNNDQIRNKAIYYENTGADIIDIGMIAGTPSPNDVTRAISIVKESVNLPISIDSLDPIEIKAAVNVGVDLIVSLDGGNMDEISSFASKIPSVVIPTDFNKNIFPKKAIEKCNLLEKNIQEAKNLGFKTLIADPILDPLINPGTMESIVAAYRYRNSHPDDLMFLGAGNVTELIDADSPGVNAFITGLAAELQVNFLLTTEVSDKVTGSVRELSKSSDMMFIAKRRDSIPKEIGINLLILKESKRKEDILPQKIAKGSKILKAKESDENPVDSKGCFRIFIDRAKNNIIAFHYLRRDSSKANIIIKGKNARDIYQTVILKDLISNLEHAAYIGSELEKAEIALRLGRSYIQDYQMF
jgi:dihydropteroate synthase-like protein